MNDPSCSQRLAYFLEKRSFPGGAVLWRREHAIEYPDCIDDGNPRRVTDIQQPVDIFLSDNRVNLLLIPSVPGITAEKPVHVQSFSFDGTMVGDRVQRSTINLLPYNVSGESGYAWYGYHGQVLSDGSSLRNKMIRGKVSYLHFLTPEPATLRAGSNC